MSTFATDLVDSIIELPFEFAKVVTEAGPRPVAGLLIAIGGLFILASVGVFGYLTLGAVMDLVMPDVSSEPPNREAR
jgi:hypothetical protein